ncbi:DUF3794 domain-containing protein, partial [Neobacillus vireti]|uniref:CsxC family protein n=1 Tax=Neobacillus vireti TaxID=220686 RepID=UPI003000B000
MSDKEKPSCQNFDQSASVDNCSNVNVPPDVNPDASIAKIPIVLAEIAVSTNLVANITFPEDVLEIKDIKKRVALVQCRLLVPSNQLFIKGYVEKNIQYVTPIPSAKWSKSINSKLRSFTVKVPFECVTEVKEFLTRPLDVRLNQRNEFDFFISQPLPNGFPEKDRLLTSDLSQFHQASTQFFNEQPYCELISGRIVEWDESTDRMLLPGEEFEGTFRNVVEKMTVTITLKILQKQQVPISGVVGPTGATGPTG